MITLVSVEGLATVQDGGRPGRMHEGVPPGGALAPELLARANAAVGNAPGEAAVEIIGALVLRVEPETDVASDDGARVPRGDASWQVASHDRGVCYVALRGGVDVPMVLGGRGTLLTAGFGGLEGRPLRAGDVLRSRGAKRMDCDTPPPPDPTAPLRIVPGPDFDRFAAHAIDVLCTASFVVSARSDRTGVRLAGPPIPTLRAGDTGPSAPMLRGAVQVPPSGEPIVLGPDHPTTGGYPVVAAVTRACWGSLACRPSGTAVRFALVG